MQDDDDIDFARDTWRRHPKDQSNRSDLTRRRWTQPVMTDGEIRDAIRDGSAQALEPVVKAFHRLVVKLAAPYCSRSNNHDVIAAGMLGLVEAARRFDPRRNNTFGTYAKQHILSAIKAEAKRMRRNGWGGETRLERAVYGNHALTPDQASKVMGGPVDQGEIEIARRDVLGVCAPMDSYDATEPYEDKEEKET